MTSATTPPLIGAKPDLDNDPWRCDTGLLALGGGLATRVARPYFPAGGFKR